MNRQHNHMHMVSIKCNCEFCEPCPYCGHKADEHMAGDFEAGICFICQRLGCDNCSDMQKQVEESINEV